MVHQKQVWAVNELLVLSGCFFLLSDKCDKIYKTEKRQTLTLASKMVKNIVIGLVHT